MTSATLTSEPVTPDPVTSAPVAPTPATSDPVASTPVAPRRRKRRRSGHHHPLPLAPRSAGVSSVVSPNVSPGVPADVCAVVAPIATRFDAVIEWTLIALLSFSPLAFGAVDPWAEQIVVGLAVAMALMLALKLIVCPEVKFVWSWTFLPLALFLSLILFQLAPLPSALMRLLSPHSLALRSQLLAALQGTPAALPPRVSAAPISFYPYETFHSLRLLLAVAAVFIVTVNVIRTHSQLRRMLCAIAIIGFSIAAIDLLQVFSGTQKILWLIPMAHRDSGTFANHSNFGQFLNLSIAATLALAFIRKAEAASKNKSGRRSDTSNHRLQLFFQLATPIAAAIVCLTAICFSLTRGGMVGALTASVLTTVVYCYASRLGTRSWFLLGTCLICGILIATSGFDIVVDRLATLRNLHEAESARPQIAQDLWQAIKQFPLLGTGLGTHSVVYPVYQSNFFNALAYHADDEYVQLAEEVGSVGCMLIVSFLVGIVLCCRHSLTAGVRVTRAATAGLGFGLFAILVQNASDFGQQIPAIACLTAVICALLVSYSNLPTKTQLKRTSHRISSEAPAALPASPAWPFRFIPIPQPSPAFSLSLRCTAAVAVLCAGTILVVRENDARLADAHWRVALAVDSHLRPNHWLGTNDAYAQLIAAAAAAHAYEPGNVRYAHWLNVYRWQAASRARDPATGAPLITPQVQSVAARVVTELKSATALCPVFAPNYSLAGQLERLVLSQPRGTALAEAASSLWPCDRACGFAAATTEAADGRWDQALPALERYSQDDNAVYTSALDLLLVQNNKPDLAVAVAGDDPDRLLALADRFAKNAATAPLALAARQHADDLICQQATSPDAPAWKLVLAAYIHRDNNQLDSAIDLLTRALRHDNDHLDWHILLASLLAKTGDRDDALREARWCLALHPQMPEAIQIINQLNETGSNGPGAGGAQPNVSGVGVNPLVQVQDAQRG